ncbi:MAG: phosphoenolpyruvate carboxykinase domain-containing protein, partial [Steroidobacterales bacterium]
NYGDYWAHWLNIGAGLSRPPRMYHVNWFRQNAAGKILWPGFGENLRVLAWILERCAGRAGAAETAIGSLPRAQDINLRGLDISSETFADLTSVSNAAWRKEMADIRQYLLGFGSHLPAAMLAQVDEVARRLEA